MTEAKNKIASPAVAALIAIALAVFPGMAFAQSPLSISVETVQGPLKQEALYRLEIRSGTDGAQFGVQYTLPTWPTKEAVFGSPLRVTSLSLSGAGSVRSTTAPRPKPLKRFGCYRGASGALLRRVWIEMPPSSTSFLIFRVKGTYPAWPQTRYGVSFSTFSVDDPSSAELVPLGDINVPRLAPKGTRIEITAQGQAGALTTPTLVGRTVPPFRHARISLRAVFLTPSGSVGLENWTDPRPPSVALGAVQTDGRGHFRVEPHRATVRGRYAVIARSQARGSRAADWNCGAFFKVQ